MLVYFVIIWNILRSFGIFHGHLVMLWWFGMFSFVLVYCAKKNLATLVPSKVITDLGMTDHVGVSQNRIGPFFSFAEIMTFSDSGPGLPDFLWNNIPKWEKTYQMTTKLPNGHKIYQMAVMCSKWP
jgi:hypothetical protein